MEQEFDDFLHTNMFFWKFASSYWSLKTVLKYFLFQAMLSWPKFFPLCPPTTHSIPSSLHFSAYNYYLILFAPLNCNHFEGINYIIFFLHIKYRTHSNVSFNICCINSCKWAVLGKDKDYSDYHWSSHHEPSPGLDTQMLHLALTSTQ